MFDVLDEDQPIISDSECSVGLLTGLDQNGEVIIKDLALEDLSKYILNTDKDARCIKLTFPALQETKMVSFISMVYQEQGTIENNRLLVYNCLENSF